MLFDVFNDEFCADCMGNKGTGRWFVHGVSEIAHENAVNPPLRHLTNSEAAIEDAHVGVHAHIKHGVDPTMTKHVINLRPTV